MMLMYQRFFLLVTIQLWIMGCNGSSLSNTTKKLTDFLSSISNATNAKPYTIVLDFISSETPRNTCAADLQSILDSLYDVYVDEIIAETWITNETVMDLSKNAQNNTSSAPGSVRRLASAKCRVSICKDVPAVVAIYGCTAACDLLGYRRRRQRRFLMNGNEGYEGLLMGETDEEDEVDEANNVDLTTPTTNDRRMLRVSASADASMIDTSSSSSTIDTSESSNDPRGLAYSYYGYSTSSSKNSYSSYNSNWNSNSYSNKNSWNSNSYSNNYNNNNNNNNNWNSNSNNNNYWNNNNNNNYWNNNNNNNYWNNNKGNSSSSNTTSSYWNTTNTSWWKWSPTTTGSYSGYNYRGWWGTYFSSSFVKPPSGGGSSSSGSSGSSSNSTGTSNVTVAYNTSDYYNPNGTNYYGNGTWDNRAGFKPPANLPPVPVVCVGDLCFNSTNATTVTNATTPSANITNTTLDPNTVLLYDPWQGFSYKVNASNPWQGWKGNYKPKRGSIFAKAFYDAVDVNASVDCKALLSSMTYIIVNYDIIQA